MKISKNEVLEWIKWLSYTPKNIKQRISTLYTKKAISLSESELYEVIDYKESKIILKLLIKYEKGEASIDEEIKINSYIKSHNIEELMLSKLSKEQLKIAREKINNLSKVPDIFTNRIAEYYNIGENYKNMTYIDAYVLHHLLKISLENIMSSLNKNIYADTNEKLEEIETKKI